MDTEAISQAVQSATPAAQVILSIIPIVGIVIGGVVVFFYILWHHHENKQRIKMGTFEKSNFDFKSFSLLIGILLTGIGIMLSLFFGFTNGVSSPALLGGLIPLVTGISLLCFYKLNPSFWNTDK